MFIKFNIFIFILTSISILLSFCSDQVYGSDELSHHQCAKTNKPCNPYHLQPCCDNNSSCQLRNPDKYFVCKGKAKLKSFCISNEDCREIMRAVCSSDYECICKVNYTRINDTYCAPSLGTSCWGDEKCATDNAVCVDNLCQCKRNHEKFDEQCLPMMIGSPCESDEICKKVKFSKCSRQKFCICSLNTIAIRRTLCLPLLPLLNEPCQLNYHCKVNNSICVNNTCQCSSEYFPRSNNECEFIRLGMPCENILFCERHINHSTCSQYKKCVCDHDRYVMKDNKCVVLFNARCQTDDTCTTDNAMCIDNKCQCKTSHIYDGSKCIPKYLNETCRANTDCDAIKFTMCSENNKCVCRHKFVPMNKFTCTPTVGASCTENVECQPARLLCLDNKCQYYTNFSTVLNSKPVQVALGSPCQINADCTILNSKCGIHKKCVCGANTLALNESTCVSILHGSCSNDDQCYPFPVRCSYNKCQCNQDFTSVSANQCIKTNLLYSCSSDLECSDLWHSRCSNDGKCVCRSNNIATNNSTCLPILGGNCWKDDQCTTENSACIDFRCTCKPKFIAVARNQCVSID